MHVADLCGIVLNKSACHRVSQLSTLDWWFYIFRLRESSFSDENCMDEYTRTKKSRSQDSAISGVMTSNYTNKYSSVLLKNNDASDREAFVHNSRRIPSWNKIWNNP